YCSTIQRPTASKDQPKRDQPSVLNQLNITINSAIQQSIGKPINPQQSA
uniref:Uncharacterized protein n=1 Tax=Anopheles quadriannulatus TaxID=34691 RepID=A0A182XR30_ANOQN